MIENRRVLVTGASRGIGRAVCQRLYEDGYEVIGLSRSKPINWPTEIIHVAVDLSCEESLISTVRQLVSSGSFYGLVNNVGIVSSASLEDVTVEDLQQAVDLNLKAHILCAQAVLKGMRGLGAGRIVNIGSRA